MEQNIKFCKFCGFVVENEQPSNTESVIAVKNQRIKELEERLVRLESNVDNKKKDSTFISNTPFWLIPFSIIAFFGMFALIIFIITS